MKIIAYTYEADYHCIDCTRERYQSHGFTDRYGKQWRSNYGGQVDWNGVHVDVYDNEGNLVRPVFSADEWQELDANYLAENPTQYLTCGDCHKIIDTYTHNLSECWKNPALINSDNINNIPVDLVSRLLEL